MIPTVEDFETTGNEFIDTVVKLNFLTKDAKIQWERRLDDPRADDDAYAIRERPCDGVFYVYAPEGEQWTFLLYQLQPPVEFRQPDAPTVNLFFERRSETPHLQVLNEENHVAIDFPRSGSISDLMNTVQAHTHDKNQAEDFVRRFANT